MYEFPIRLGSMVFLAHRKLFAKGFLSALAPCCCLPTGNCSPIVSCPPWLHGVSYPQETVREGFPIRLGSMVFFTDRKLFAKGFLSDLIPQCFLPTGNCSRKVSYSPWLHAVSCPQETVRREISRLRFAPLEMTKGRGSMVLLTYRKLFFPSYPCKLSSCRGGSISLYLD